VFIGTGVSVGASVSVGAGVSVGRAVAVGVGIVVGVGLPVGVDCRVEGSVAVHVGATDLPLGDRIGVVMASGLAVPSVVSVLNALGTGGTFAVSTCRVDRESASSVAEPTWRAAIKVEVKGRESLPTEATNKVPQRLRLRMTASPPTSKTGILPDPFSLRMGSGVACLSPVPQTGQRFAPDASAMYEYPHRPQCTCTLLLLVFIFWSASWLPVAVLWRPGRAQLPPDVVRFPAVSGDSAYL
jgi:hypothetical protein